jgi:hypothetical protein
MRYTQTSIKKTSDGKEAFRPTILPTIPQSQMDITIATETGDRLDTLAAQFYQDPNLWWIIAAANNIHTAPIGFKDGTILRIPINYQSIINNSIK